MPLTVEEASETWISAMRNPLLPGAGVCATCRTFIDPGYLRCWACNASPSYLDVVTPITYSLALGQMHLALRNYKDGPATDRRYMSIRLLAILWRFLEAHEDCVARAAGVSRFDVVASVPSSTSERDARPSSLLHMAQACKPVAERFAPVIEVAGAAQSTHTFDANRYRATSQLPAGANVLLVDDTWTTGAHAQSAAWALKQAGARTVALVVIGRHVKPEWEIAGRTHRECFDELSPTFSWDVCAAE